MKTPDMNLAGVICLIVSLHPSQQFFIHFGTVLPGLNYTKQRIKCLAQGHNKATPARLKPQPFNLESSTLPLSCCAPL